MVIFFFFFGEALAVVWGMWKLFGVWGCGWVVGRRGRKGDGSGDYCIDAFLYQGEDKR